VASSVASLLRTRRLEAAGCEKSPLLLRPGRIWRVNTAIYELLPVAGRFPLAQRTCVQ
jgi:hypothetical protein